MGRRGYYGIGIYHPKHECNQGTLWRSAYAFGAAFVFTVGPRFTKQSSDTTAAWRHTPMLCFATIDDLASHLPHSCPLVGVELDERALSLPTYSHLTRCAYLLGAEDGGLPPGVRDRCASLLQIPSAATCLNVSTAGAIVMYDRATKEKKCR